MTTSPWLVTPSLENIVCASIVVERTDSTLASVAALRGMGQGRLVLANCAMCCHRSGHVWPGSKGRMEPREQFLSNRHVDPAY